MRNLSEANRTQSELIHPLAHAYMVYCQRCRRVLSVFGSLGSVPYSFRCEGCGAVSKARLCHRLHRRKRIVVLSCHSRLGIEVWSGLPDVERRKWLEGLS